MAIFQNGLCARHAVLNDAAVGAAAVAKYSVQYTNIELRTGRWGSGRWRHRGRKRRSAGRRRLVQPLRELEWVPMPFVLHVHDMWRHVFELIVETRDLKPIVE